MNKPNSTLNSISIDFSRNPIIIRSKDYKSLPEHQKGVFNGCEMVVSGSLGREKFVRAKLI